MLSKAFSDLIRGLKLYRVWFYQAYHDISSKYKRTVFGSLWISGAMVATSLALAVVMGGIQGQKLEVVLPYVMAGILSFSISGVYILNEAPEVYMAHGNIIKNHAYPFSYYTLESATKSFLVFAHNIVAFYIALLLLGAFVAPHWSLIFGLLLVYINAVLWGTLSSMMSARFRDLRFMLPFVGQMAFFLTPVFWVPSSVAGWRSALISFNPFYGLVEVIRSPLLGQMPPVLALQQVAIFLAVGIVLWATCFGALRSKIAFWV